MAKPMWESTRKVTKVNFFPFVVKQDIVVRTLVVRQDMARTRKGTILCSPIVSEDDAV